MLVLLACTLGLHLPFISQSVQGDEPTYLRIAQEVIRQPLTPQNFTYVFQGRRVEASGHPHPPVASYIAAAAWAVRGCFSERFLHLVFLVFPLGVGLAIYVLALRFEAPPLWAALLAATSPLVQVNSNTVASPEPIALFFIAAGVAAFVWERWVLAALALAVAGLTALQGLVIPVILALWLLWSPRRGRPAVLTLMAPFAAMLGWEALQWLLTGRLPIAVMLEHMRDPALSGLKAKGGNALLLLQHLGWAVTVLPLAVRRAWGVAAGLGAAWVVPEYPWWERLLLVVFVAMGVNAVLWIWERRKDSRLLAAWALLYFAFAVVAFFAGAARYLMPIVPPMVVLLARQWAGNPKKLALAVVINAVVGLNLSFAAYEFARVYAEVPPPPGPRFLVNGDWGFRYHLMQRGGRPLERASVPQKGEWIATSALSLGGRFGSLAEDAAVPLWSMDLAVKSPLRLIDLHAHSGFSSVSGGLLSVSFSTQPLDRITYSRTSPFIFTPNRWMPTLIGGRLVYLPQGDSPVYLSLSPQDSVLQLALFSQGKGDVTYEVAEETGQVLFRETIQADGTRWEPRRIPQRNARRLMLKIQAPSSVRAGWGELVTY